MAATSRGIVASSALVAEFKTPASRASSTQARSKGVLQRRGLVLLPSARNFRAFRTIKKSPRLNRSASRVFMKITTSALLQGDQTNNYFTSSGIQRDLQEDDVTRRDSGANDDENGDSTVVDPVVDTVNAVLADIVDGQKYIKETGRTKPRPMKRRALVVSLALSAFRGPLNDVEGRLASLRRSSSSGGRLARTPSSSGFARTAYLISQLSFGSPHAASQGTDIH